MADGSRQTRVTALSVPWTSKTIRGKMAKFKFLLQENIHEALKKVALKFMKDLKVKRLSGPETTDKTLRARTGQLRDSFNWSIKGRTLGDLEFRVWTTIPYAKTHEYGTKGAGGTLDDIVPRRASWLTIPLKAALTPSGVAKGTAREVGGEYEGVVFRRTEDDGGHPKLIMYGREGDSLVPLFRLVKRVAIPPRLGFFDTWRRIARYRNKVMGKAINQAKKDTK